MDERAHRLWACTEAGREVRPSCRARPPSRHTNLERGGVSAMLSWQVGRVKITRILEMDLPVPAEFMAGATPVELRNLPWLYPHFVSDDDATLNLSVHALLVEAP